jgi:hypothetical protein
VGSARRADFVEPAAYVQCVSLGNQRLDTGGIIGQRALVNGYLQVPILYFTGLCINGPQIYYTYTVLVIEETTRKHHTTGNGQAPYHYIGIWVPGEKLARAGVKSSQVVAELAVNLVEITSHV